MKNCNVIARVFLPRVEQNPADYREVWVDRTSSL